MEFDRKCAAHNGAARNAPYAATQPGAGTDRSRQLLELIGLIFDAALDPAVWPEALNNLADATGAHVGALGSYDVRTNTLANVAPRQDPDYQRSYQEHWASRNPFRQMWQPNPPLGVLTPEQFIPRDEYTRTDFFREWVVPQHIEAAIATNTLSDDGVSAVPHPYRPWRIGDFDQDEIDLFAALIPLIRRAIQLQHRLAALEMQRASSAAAFDRLRDGVIIVDDHFDIVFANRSAEELLAEGDGLIQDGNGIAAATPAGTATLRRLVAAVPNGNRPPEPGGRCTLGRRDGRSPLAVLVVPLDAEVAWVVPRRPAAVLFVTDPDRDSRASSEALRRRFGLTPAEAAFLAEIVKGDGIQAAADRLGVSLATARTHLRHVFEKTGTQRQAELVGLAMNGHALV
jgi:DNA-binding CsgD family transcriptional regulator/PAS domain-containing protein